MKINFENKYLMRDNHGINDKINTIRFRKFPGIKSSSGWKINSDELVYPDYFLDGQKHDWKLRFMMH